MTVNEKQAMTPRELSAYRLKNIEDATSSLERYAEKTEGLAQKSRDSESFDEKLELYNEIHRIKTITADYLSIALSEEAHNKLLSPVSDDHLLAGARLLEKAREASRAIRKHFEQAQESMMGNIAARTVERYSKALGL